MMRPDLEAWAKALDVETDDDAAALLGGWLDRLEVATRELATLSRLTQRAPENFNAARLQQAYKLADVALVDLARVLNAFYRHERGER